MEGHSKVPFIPLAVCPFFPACSVRFGRGGPPKVALSKSWANASRVQPAAPGRTECCCYTQSM